MIPPSKGFPTHLGAGGRVRGGGHAAADTTSTLETGRAPLEGCRRSREGGRAGGGGGRGGSRWGGEGGRGLARQPGGRLEGLAQQGL